MARFRTEWNKSGHPYWVVPVRLGKQADDGNIRPSYCYLRFGGKRYLFQFGESKKDDVAMWIRVTSMSFRAGYGYSTRYRSYRRTYRRKPYGSPF